MTRSARLFGVTCFLLLLGVLAVVPGWASEVKLLIFAGGFAIGYAVNMLITDILGGWDDGEYEDGGDG